VLGQDGLVKQLTGRLLQKIMEAEMTRKLRFRPIWGMITQHRKEMDVANAVGTPFQDWVVALNQFAIVFGNERAPLI
jgi:hypothetical protein